MIAALFTQCLNQSIKVMRRCQATNPKNGKYCCFLFHDQSSKCKFMLNEFFELNVRETVDIGENTIKL